MKYLYLLLLSSLLTSCGAKKIAVQNADLLVEHQIKKRLPLSSNQKDALAKDVDAYLNQSKKEVQELIPIIDSLNIENPGPLGERYNKVEEIYRKLADGAATLTSTHMAKLDKKQQETFFETLRKEDRKLEEKTPSKRKAELLERVQKLLGELKPEQESILASYQEDYFNQRHIERLKRRQVLRERFQEIYRSEGSEETRKAAFYKAFKEYQQKSLENTKTLEIIEKFVPTISAEQKTVLRNHVRELKEIANYFLSTEY